MPRLAIISVLLLFMMACGGGSSSRGAFEGPITVPFGGNAPGPGQGDPADDPGSGTELDQARQRWIDSGIVNYRYTLQRSAFAPQSFTDPVRVEVRGGQVVSQTYVNTGQAIIPMNTNWWTTIDGLFDILQNAYDGDADSIQVTYDPQLGFPTFASIDYVFGLADEEVGWTASNLTTLP